MLTALRNGPSLVNLFSEGRTTGKCMNCVSVKTSQSMSFSFCLHSIFLNEDVSYFLRSDLGKHVPESYQRAGLCRPLSTANTTDGSMCHKSTTRPVSQTTAPCCKHWWALTVALFGSILPYLMQPTSQEHTGSNWSMEGTWKREPLPIGSESPKKVINFRVTGPK